MNEVDKLRYILAELLADHDLRPDQIKTLSAEKFDALNAIFKKTTGNSVDQLFKLIKAKEATDDGVIFDEQMSRCWADKYAQCNTIFNAFNIKHELHDFYSINEICIYLFSQIPGHIKEDILSQLDLPDFLSLLIIYTDSEGTPTGKFEYLL